jgi:SAM-dependent methyltransferase
LKGSEIGLAITRKVDAYYAVDRTEFFDFIGGHHINVLEVGCGAGASASWLRAHGAQHLVGVELDNTAAERARDQFDEVHAKSIEDALDELNGPFDLIVCADVLEHLNDPWTVVDRLRRLAGQQGVLAISIPNVRFLGTLGPIAFGSGFAYPQGDAYDAHGTFDITHIRFFTRGNVRSLLEGAGWEPLRWGSPRGRRWPRLRALLARITRERSNEYLAAQWYVIAQPAGTSQNQD